MRFGIALIGLLAFVITGCTDLGAIRAMRDDAQRTRDVMGERAERLETLRERYPDESPVVPEIDASLARTRASIEALDAAVLQIDQVLEEAANPSDGLTRTAQGLGPYLPEPVRLPLVLGAALGATLLRSGQLKKGALSIAQSINKAVEGDEGFRDALARNAGTLRSVQTPTARRIVDQAGSRNILTALPI